MTTTPHELMRHIVTQVDEQEATSWLCNTAIVNVNIAALGILQAIAFFKDIYKGGGRSKRGYASAKLSNKMF